MKILYSLILSLSISLLFCGRKEPGGNEVNLKVHTFYYAWFGNPEYDGTYIHWNHHIVKHWSDTILFAAPYSPEKEDIGANFYPALGSYSSNDPEIISRHMKLIKEAGIGVVAISWWGKDSYTDKSALSYLDHAQKSGLKICFHIEPVYKSIEEFKEQLEYLSAKYLEHPALFKHNDKPLYYIYNSHKIKYNEWNKLFDKDGLLSIRSTPLDASFIGLWERQHDGGFFLESGFDGFYTYYGSEGFMYGSTSSNWQYLSEFAKENQLIFIPSVAPGYIDTRIRPWNDRNTRDREEGKYYERMFINAINADPDFISITSFNEWHEGTQIEPAIPKSLSSYKYEDYGDDLDPMYYIKKTKELIIKYQNNSQTK